MNRQDRLADWAHGKVWGYFKNPVTGETTQPFAIHNIITYTGADIMARLMGGDIQYTPKYVGFIYGTTATPGIPEPITSRDQTWLNLGNELAAVNKANILITPFALNPAYTIDVAAGLPQNIYKGNSVTIAAHTGNRLEYGFTAGTYANPLADSNYIYHAMLLTRLVSGTSITYLPFARVSLLNTTYQQKPAGMEMSLFWAITYN